MKTFHKKPKSHTTYKIVKVSKGLRNDAVQCAKKWVPKVPPQLPKLPCLFGGIGVVKSGKTNAFVNLLSAYLKCGAINCAYCISVSYDSNASLQTIPFEEGGIFTDAKTCIAALNTIQSMIKDKVDEYEFEQQYKAIYEKFRRSGWSVGVLTFDEIQLLQQEEYRPPEHIPKPSPAIFIDDMTHTPLMANTLNNELTHLCLHHRHLHGVGVTIMLALQSFKSGMPKVVRTNLGGILLFPTCNMVELDEIHKEVGNNVTFDTFKQLFFEATKEKHGFLFIDRLTDDETQQFVINFDRKFVVDPKKERHSLLFPGEEYTEDDGRGEFDDSSSDG